MLSMIMVVYFSVVNENLANHIHKCRFGGRRACVLGRKFIHLRVSCSKVPALYHFVYSSSQLGDACLRADVKQYVVTSIL